jgi:hypothetical protein
MAILSIIAGIKDVDPQYGDHTNAAAGIQSPFDPREEPTDST